MLIGTILGAVILKGKVCNYILKLENPSLYMLHFVIKYD